MLGFDTETYQGYPKVLCTSKGKYIESSDTYSLLSFLSKQNDNFVGWNSFYDLNAILKSYIIDNSEKLRKDWLEYSDSLNELNIEEFHLRIIPNKSVKITDTAYSRNSRKAFYVYDASNFYATSYGHLTLDYASNKYLGKRKINTELNLDRKRIGEERGYYQAHRKDIIKYCISDSKLTLELFNLIRDTLHKLHLPIPKKWSSLASIHKRYLFNKKLLLGNEKNFEIVKSFVPAIEKVYFGGLFETMSLGSYNNIVELDINSAYPYAMIHLPEMDGKVYLGTSKGFEDCYYRIYKIRSKLTPFMPYRNNEKLFYGYSKTEKSFYINAIDKELLDSNGIRYKIIESFGFGDNGKYPFRYVKKYYDEKFDIKNKFGKDSPEYHFIKIFLNSGYGILAQRKPIITRYTNLVYASYITSICRSMIRKKQRELESRGYKVLSLNTDGILASKRDSELISSEQLGEWSVKKYDKAIIFCSGVYFLYKGNYVETRHRGLRNFNPDTISKCYEGVYIENTRQPIKLKKSIIENRVNDINVFIDDKKVFSPIGIANSKYEVPERLLQASMQDFMNEQFKCRYKMIN